MKLFSAYTKTSPNNEVQDISFISNGFSIKAFILCPWILFFKGFAKHGIGYLLVLFILSKLLLTGNGENWPEYTFYLELLILNLYVGICYNDWIRLKLTKLGYEEIYCNVALSGIEFKAMFYKDNPDILNNFKKQYIEKEEKKVEEQPCRKYW